MIPVVHSVAELRRALAPLRGEGVALVPTMGALHDGHLSLVALAGQRARHVVVSIFVNPTQFAPHEDFAAYPRDLAADIRKLETGRTSLIFAPEPGELYPEGFSTTIQMGGPARGLESDFRPHFFAGVATVVAKLLIAALPDVAVFGEKDYQQLLVVKRLVGDLALPCEILAGAISREADGLALSSRNAYLDPRQRKIAGQLNVVLRDAVRELANGAAIGDVEQSAARSLSRAGFDSVDYVAIRNAENLERPAPGKPGRILAAARIGRTRLIDNMAI